MALPLCPDQFWLFYSEFQPRIRTAGAYIPAACPLLFGGWGAGFDRSCIFFYLWTVHICLVEKKRVSIRSCSTHRVRNVSQKSYNWWRHGQTLLWLAQLVSRYKYGYVALLAKFLDYCIVSSQRSKVGYGVSPVTNGSCWTCSTVTAAHVPSSPRESCVL